MGVKHLYFLLFHYGGVTMDAMASQITIVYSIVYSGADQRNIKTPRHWPLTGEFPAPMASNAENVSIWWNHVSTPKG